MSDKDYLKRFEKLKISEDFKEELKSLNNQDIIFSNDIGIV